MVYWDAKNLTVKEVSKSIWAGASPLTVHWNWGMKDSGKKNIWSGHLNPIHAGVFLVNPPLPPSIGRFPKERMFCSGIASLTWRASSAWVLESMRRHLRLPDIALLTALCSRLETDSKADFVLLLSVRLWGSGRDQVKESGRFTKATKHSHSHPYTNIHTKQMKCLLGFNLFNLAGNSQRSSDGRCWTW